MTKPFRDPKMAAPNHSDRLHVWEQVEKEAVERGLIEPTACPTCSRERSPYPNLCSDAWHAWMTVEEHDAAMAAQVEVANRVLADERASFKVGLDLLTIELDDMTSYRDYLRDASDATILKLAVENEALRELAKEWADLIDDYAGGQYATERLASVLSPSKPGETE